jgi:PTH1 family peptidyl-tRNA hydrolase
MKMIVGLGNPGSQYARTRHNAGFMVVDRLASRHAPGAVTKAKNNAAVVEANIGGEKCLLVKPTTYMNRSGQPVADALNFYKLSPAEDLFIVVDDFYLPTGTIRIRPGGGTGGHNGLSDVQRCLGADNYPRLRLGVGLQPSGGKPAFMDQADFVLSRFAAEEEGPLETSIGEAADAVEMFVSKGLAAAMNKFNRKGAGGSE